MQTCQSVPDHMGHVFVSRSISQHVHQCQVDLDSLAPDLLHLTAWSTLLKVCQPAQPSQPAQQAKQGQPADLNPCLRPALQVQIRCSWSQHLQTPIRHPFPAQYGSWRWRAQLTRPLAGPAAEERPPLQPIKALTELDLKHELLKFSTVHLFPPSHPLFPFPPLFVKNVLEAEGSAILLRCTHFFRDSQKWPPFDLSQQESDAF
jgi:hypothetical protein